MSISPSPADRLVAQSIPGAFFRYTLHADGHEAVEPLNLETAVDRLLLVEMLCTSTPCSDRGIHHFGEQRCAPAGLALRAVGRVASPRGQ